MKWVTREFVHVDRTACPWLIKGFIDPKAKFIFAPLEKITDIVRTEGAIPYDCPNVELGHHGEKCSFDSIVRKYNVKDPAVLDMARIVRAADTDNMDLAPESAGLEAVMTGISYLAKDDHDAVKRAAIVYDALYIHCLLKNIRAEHKAKLEKLDKKEKRKFLKARLKERLAHP